MKTKLLFTFLILLYCIEFFSCTTLQIPYTQISVVLNYLLLAYSLFNVDSKRSVFVTPMRMIILSMFLSFIPAYIIYNQTIYQSLFAVAPAMLGVNVYFLLLKWRIYEKDLLKILIWLSIIWTIIEIAQQITYPIYIFNGRPPSEFTGLENRMGFWRFYVFGVDYALLAFMFVYYKVLKGEKKERFFNIFSMIFIFIGIVLFLARKSIYGTISCIFIGVLFSNKKLSTSSKIVITIAAAVVVYMLSWVMSDLNIQTNKEFVDEDFIRYLAASFFINEVSDSPLYYLFGAGAPYGGSRLGVFISSLADSFHFFQADCGIVGYFSMFGLLGVAAYVFLIVKIIINRKYVDFPLILYLIIRLELIFFDFWGIGLRGVTAFAVYVYLLECSIRKNKQIALRRS